MPTVPDPNDPDIAKWLAANLPWVFSACVAFLARLLRLLSQGKEPWRTIICECLLVSLIALLGGPVFTYFGVSTAFAGAIGCAIGLLGAEAIRSALFGKIANMLGGNIKDKSDE